MYKYSVFKALVDQKKKMKIFSCKNHYEWVFVMFLIQSYVY